MGEVQSLSVPWPLGKWTPLTTPIPPHSIACRLYTPISSWPP